MASGRLAGQFISAPCAAASSGFRGAQSSYMIRQNPAGACDQQFNVGTARRGPRSDTRLSQFVQSGKSSALKQNCRNDSNSDHWQRPRFGYSLGFDACTYLNRWAGASVVAYLSVLHNDKENRIRTEQRESNQVSVNASSIVAIVCRRGVMGALRSRAPVGA